MRTFIAAAVAVTLCAVPTAAVAAVPRTPVVASPAPVAAAPSNPWLTLSAMTAGSSAATIAAAQAEEAKRRSPPIAPLAVILATIGLGIYILWQNNDGRGGGGRRFIEGITGGSLFGEPISPA